MENFVFKIETMVFSKFAEITGKSMAEVDADTTLEEGHLDAMNEALLESFGIDMSEVCSGRCEKLADYIDLVKKVRQQT